MPWSVLQGFLWACRGMRRGGLLLLRTLSVQVTWQVELMMSESGGATRDALLDGFADTLRDLRLSLALAGSQCPWADCWGLAELVGTPCGAGGVLCTFFSADVHRSAT